MDPACGSGFVLVSVTRYDEDSARAVRRTSWSSVDELGPVVDLIASRTNREKSVDWGNEQGTAGGWERTYR